MKAISRTHMALDILESGLSMNAGPSRARAGFRKHLLQTLPGWTSSSTNAHHHTWRFPHRCRPSLPGIRPTWGRKKAKAIENTWDVPDSWSAMNCFGKMVRTRPVFLYRMLRRRSALPSALGLYRSPETQNIIVQVDEGARCSPGEAANEFKLQV